MIQEPWEIHWKDYYKILEIERDASEKTIKKKYRKLARLYHPDNNQGNHEAEEKFKDISEAYKILSDPSKKQKYDQAWENKKRNPNVETNTENINSNQTNNSSQTNAENINYEDIEKNFTAEEKRYAKRLALQHIIEEELEKVGIILETKNELIISAYNNQYEKREFYNKVKELVNIANEYINGLIKLKEEAYKYDLLKEEELINDTIEFLECELQNIPLTPKEATHNIEKELYKEHIKERINEEINISNEVIEKLKSILIYVDNHQITHLDYNAITNNILLEGKNSLSKLKEILKISIDLKLEEECKELLINQIKKLNAKLYTMPKTYEEAKSISAYIVIINNIEETYDKSKILGEKIIRIMKLLEKHPLSNYCDRLIEYSTNALNETINEIENILQNKNKIFENIAKNKNRKIEEVEKISKEAVKLYEKAEEIHQNANNIYMNKQLYYIEDKDFYALCDSAIATWDKNKSFEMLIKANEIKEILNSLSPNYDFNNLYSKLKSKKDELERMLHSINTIKQEILEKRENEYRKEQEQKRKFKNYGKRQSRNNNGLIEELNKLKIELVNYKKTLKKDLIKISAFIPVFYLDSINENEKIIQDLSNISMCIFSIISLSGMFSLTYRFAKYDPISKLDRISEIEKELQLKRK